MEHISPDIQEIIIRHLQQQTSQPEEKQLSAWVDASPQNKAGFEEIKRIWSHTHPEADAFSPDTSAAWEKVKKQTVLALKGESTPNRGRVVAMPGRIWQVAASVALLCTIGYLLFLTSKREETWQSVSSSTGKKQVYLPDSTRVWLNKNSQLSWSDFEGDTREVKLQGEAFFEVRRKPEQPFRIHGLQSLTEVLGTSFNLKSVPGKPDAVEVVTGLVAFSSTRHPDVKVNLTPGTRGELDKSGKATESTITGLNFRAWQTEQLSFENAPLDEVARELEQYFDVAVEIQDSALVRCRFTGSFKSPQLHEVLQVLSASVNLKAEQKEDGYLLHGMGCP